VIPMGRRDFAVWVGRFVLFASIYAAGAIWQFSKVSGWKGLEAFAIAVGFFLFGTLAWLVALIAGHRIQRLSFRFVSHPVLAAALFAGIGFVLVSTTLATEPGWGQYLPAYLLVVAGAAAADAALGFALERWRMART